jgi:hypothetical protein
LPLVSSHHLGQNHPPPFGECRSQSSAVAVGIDLDAVVVG